MIWLLRQFRLVRDAVYAKDTPRQMALGLAIGAMLGLIPKGNLLAIAIATLLFGTRVSVATGMLSAAIFSLLSPFCDPLTHRMGDGLLTQTTLVPVWRWLSRLPLAAWTSFNNTVVMGNLIFGGILFYPIYRLSLPWITRYRQAMQVQASGDGELVAESTPCSATTPVEATSAEAAQPAATTAEATAAEERDVCELQVHSFHETQETRPRQVRPAKRRDCA